MKGLHGLAFLLLIVGGLNWLVVGIWNTDLGAWLGGGSVAKVIYVLVGLAAVYELFTHKKLCKSCDKGQMSGGNQ
ncbi:MAG: DUF378 domain-containing protein [Patescibacteria group bacterium]